MKYHYYQLHNFRLRSTMPFPELFPIPPQETEITIREGQPPAHLKAPLKKGQAYGGFHTYEYSPGEFLLELKDIGRILIRDGRRVEVEKYSGVPEDQFRMYFLTSGIGYLLHLRGSFALHASAVDLDNSCILFTGDCGAGKSTTAAQFMRAGYKLLSDDVTVLEINEEGKVIAYPSLPIMKLWEDSASMLNYNVNQLDRLLPEYEKYRMNMKEKFTPIPKPVHTIYSLHLSDEEQPTIQSLKGFDKTKCMLNNIYRKKGIDIFDLSTQQFIFSNNLAQSIPSVKRLNRSSQSKKLLQRLVENIEDDLKVGTWT